MDILFAHIPEAWFDTIGVSGFALYVINYGLLTFNKLTSQQLTYFVLNFLAASLVLISLFGAFNLASALIQVFWIVISIAAIYLRLRRDPAQDYVARVRRVAAE